MKEKKKKTRTAINSHTGRRQWSHLQTRFPGLSESIPFAAQPSAKSFTGKQLMVPGSKVRS